MTVSDMKFKPLIWGWIFAYRFSSDGKWIMKGKRVYFKVWFPKPSLNMKGITILIGGVVFGIAKLRAHQETKKENE